MELTTEWMAENFAKFNTQYFNSELLIPKFAIINTWRKNGSCGAKNWRTEHPNFTIRLSNHFERTEYDYQCTLLHEMIHLYWQSKGEWEVGHGEKFVEMAMRLREMGWDISIPYDSEHYVKQYKEAKRTQTVEIAKSIEPKTTPAKTPPSEQGKTNTNSIMNTQNIDEEYAAFARMSVEWKQIWCVKKGTGVELHCKFVINNAKDKSCKICGSLHYAESDYMDMDIKELYDFSTRKCPPIRESGKEITPSYESATFKDVMFRYPYSDLIDVDDDFMTKLMFKQSEVRLFRLSIVYNNKHFPCEAIFPLKIVGEKKLFRKPEYRIRCADKSDIVIVPFDNNGVCNDPKFVASLQKEVRSKAHASNATQNKPSHKPVPLNNNPLSEALRKVMNDRILSSHATNRIIFVDSDVNQAASMYRIPWDEIFKPDTEYYISNALLALVDNRYINSTLRVKYLITDLREKGL